MANTEPMSASAGAPAVGRARAASGRFFLALWPDPAVRAALHAQQQRWHWPRGAALVAAPRLHLTLHFIGDVALDRLPALRDGLAVPAPPIALVLGRAALWPHGLAVLEPLDVPDALRALHADLALALQRLALPVETRPFRPHVTLARRAAKAVVPGPAPAWGWDAQGYALMRSRPGPDGGYEAVQHWP